MIKRLAVAAALLSAHLIFFSSPVQAKDKLIMGVIPYKPPVELQKIFKPIAEYLSKETGKQIELQIGQTYDDAAMKVGTGKFDFAFLGPAIYIDAQRQYGVVPLSQVANNGKPTFHCAVAVKKGSPIKSMAEFKGKKFAFGERNSTMSHVVPLWMLMNAGVKLSDLKEHAFLKTHDNVALNIFRGTFDGGGLQPDVAEKYKDQGLEVIAASPEIPDHVFVASKSLDNATADQIQRALLSGKAVSVLKGIKGSISGTVKFTDKDFDILRKITKEVALYLNK